MWSGVMVMQTVNGAETHWSSMVLGEFVCLGYGLDRRTCPGCQGSPACNITQGVRQHAAHSYGYSMPTESWFNDVINIQGLSSERRAGGNKAEIQPRWGQAVRSVCSALQYHIMWYYHRF